MRFLDDEERRRGAWRMREYLALGLLFVRVERKDEDDEDGCGR